jgi:hypothetical protein
MRCEMAADGAVTAQRVLRRRRDCPKGKAYGASARRGLSPHGAISAQPARNVACSVAIGRAIVMMAWKGHPVVC